jgi:hypothetical protein
MLSVLPRYLSLFHFISGLLQVADLSEHFNECTGINVPRKTVDTAVNFITGM